MEDEVHTFRAPSLQDALSLVRKRLGRGALILHSREVEAAGLSFLGWSGGRPLIEVQAVAEDVDPDALSPASYASSRIDSTSPAPPGSTDLPAAAVLEGPQRPATPADSRDAVVDSASVGVRPRTHEEESRADAAAEAAVAAWKPTRRSAADDAKSHPTETDPSRPTETSPRSAVPPGSADGAASERPGTKAPRSAAGRAAPTRERPEAAPAADALRSPHDDAAVWEVLEGWRRTLGSPPILPRDPLAWRMVLRGIAPDWAERIAEEARAAAGPNPDPAALREALHAALAGRLPAVPAAALPERARCVAVLGAAGVGKTTFLLRLAADLKANFGKSTTLVHWRPPTSLDSPYPAAVPAAEPPSKTGRRRTARRLQPAAAPLAPAAREAELDVYGGEALRSAAQRVGASFVEIESPRDWKARAALAAGADVVLLDVPGGATREEVKLREIRFFLKQAPVANVYVALHAAWSAAGCRDALQAWSGMSPVGAVVVHGDAASDWASALSASTAASAPVVLASLRDCGVGRLFRPSPRDLAERWLHGLEIV